MPAYRYSVIQYVPNSVRDERLNIGVVVAGAETTFFGSRIVKATERTRLRRLGASQSLDFLPSISAELKRSAVTESQLLQTGPWNGELLEVAARDWANTIQFTPLRAAVADDPNELLDALFDRLVADPAAPRQRARDRRWVHKEAVKTLRQAVPSGFDFSAHVREDAMVIGALESHTFDLELANGSRLRLIQALAASGARATEHVDGMAWTIDDVRKSEPDIPIGVLAVGTGQALERARILCEGLGAELVRRPAMEAWLRSAATELVGAVGPSAP